MSNLGELEKEPRGDLPSPHHSYLCPSPLNYIMLFIFSIYTHLIYIYILFFCLYPPKKCKHHEKVKDTEECLDILGSR